LIVHHLLLLCLGNLRFWCHLNYLQILLSYQASLRFFRLRLGADSLCTLSSFQTVRSCFESVSLCKLLHCRL
jgi:hypothetical protein